MTLTNILTSIADAIRHVEGSTDVIPAQDFLSRIQGLSDNYDFPTNVVSDDILRDFFTNIANSVRVINGGSSEISVSELGTKIQVLKEIIDNAQEQPLYKVGLLSDVHIPYEKDADGNGHTDWQDACLWYQEQGVSAICIAGDLTADGTEKEMNEWLVERDKYRGTIPVYSCTGNHEEWNGQRLSMHTQDRNSIRKYLDSDTTENGSSTFMKIINGDVYVFLSVFPNRYGYAGSNTYMFAPEDLNWLEDVLSTYRNQRVFIFEHIPPSASITGNFWNANGLYTLDLWKKSKLTTDRNRFLDMLKYYKNTFWFSGHSHIKWERETEYPGLNYQRYNGDGCQMVHLSSTTIPRDIVDGAIGTQLYAEGQGAIMEVYTNRVVIKGYDLIQQKYVDEFNLNLDTTPVNIAERTVADTTLVSYYVQNLTTNYNVGDTFSIPTSSVSLRISYSDGAYEQIDNYLWSVDKSNLPLDENDIFTESGNFTLKFLHLGTEVLTRNIVVQPSEEEAIYVSTEVNKTKTTYYMGEDVDSDDIIVQYKFSDGTTEDIDFEIIQNANSNSVGTNNFIISYIEYDGSTQNVLIPITIIEQPSGEPTDETIDIVWNDGKIDYDNNGAIINTLSYYYSDFIDYQVGDTFTITNGNRNGTYPSIRLCEYDENGGWLYCSTEDDGYVLKPTDSTKDFTVTMSNARKLRLRMNCKSTLKDEYITKITLVRHRIGGTTEPTTPTLTSISATKTTTTYNVGDTINTNDIVVTATYSDNSTQTVSGWSASSVDTSTSGTKTMTISYNGKTTTINIVINEVVVEKTLSSITLNSNKSTYNVGDTFDSSKYTVTAHYSDGTSETVSGYSLNTIDLTTSGTKTLTATYQGKTSSVSITVNEVVTEPSDNKEGICTIGTVTYGKKINYDYGMTLTISGSSTYGYAELTPCYPNTMYKFDVLNIASTSSIKIVFTDDSNTIVGASNSISTSGEQVLSPNKATKAYFRIYGSSASSLQAEDISSIVISYTQTFEVEEGLLNIQYMKADYNQTTGEMTNIGSARTSTVSEMLENEGGNYQFSTTQQLNLNPKVYIAVYNENQEFVECRHIFTNTATGNSATVTITEPYFRIILTHKTDAHDGTLLYFKVKKV